MAAKLTKLPPRLTVVKGNRQHWGRRLDKWRVKYGLSLRDLVAVIDNTIGKSALHDLVSGNCAPRMEAVIKPIIAGRLRQYLKTTHKKSSLEIEQEMLEIFHEPVCDKETEPVLTQRFELSKSAQKYFGLNFDPFNPDRLPKGDEVFSNAPLDRVFRKLEDAVNYQGFVAIIGEVGSGKTEMQRRLARSCDDSKGKQVILWCEEFNIEQMHSGSIAGFILRKFDQKVPQDRMMRAERLKEMLAGLSDAGTRVALGFDDCHRLDPRLLTALKRFWELGSGGYTRYLGLLLFGQPKFKITLQSAAFREITERLNIIQLPMFSDKGSKALDAWDYVTIRIKVAGGNAEKLFDRTVITALAETGPTPLALGNLCNAVLLKARELEEKKVHKGILTAAGLVQSGEPKVGRIRSA